MAAEKFIENEARDGIINLLLAIGEDPEREGLLDTPKRVVKAWKEMCGGYSIDPIELLQKNFALDDNEDEPLFGTYGEMIISKHIPFVSNCEHHMMPFIGQAHVGYIPRDTRNGGRIVGLSKIARVVDAFARRLQVQERMTQQIADTMMQALDPLGVAVVVEATHSCQAYRGIKKQGTMVTSALYGVFRDNDNQARSEFLELIKHG